MALLTGRLAPKRLLKSALIIVAALLAEYVIEQTFGLFTSTDGIAQGRQIESGLLYAVSQFSPGTLFARLFVNAANLMGGTYAATQDAFGIKLLSQAAAFVAWPFGLLASFLWTPIDVVMRVGAIGIVSNLLQIVAGFFLLRAIQPTKGKGLWRHYTDGDHVIERATGPFVLAFAVLLMATIIANLLYVVLVGGTALFGWALNLAAVFLTVILCLAGLPAADGAR